jgi:hypothetical protein
MEEICIKFGIWEREINHMQEVKRLKLVANYT